MFDDEYVDVDLTGQVAVITGAGRGFGLAFARTLCEHGAISILAELDSDLGQAAEAELQAQGLQAYFAQLDVSDPLAVETIARDAQTEHSRLDIWINNAGLARHQPSEDVSLENWQIGMGVMLSGVFYGCQSAGRIMLAQGRGNIINIASVNGLAAQPGRVVYNSAKSAVIHLTATLGCEWARRGLRVNAIAPNVFMTELARESINNSGAASMASYINRCPARRLGDMPELLGTILFLVSDQSSYITGQTLRVDGGFASDHYL